MPRIWNGHDISKEAPELGLRIDFASLIPDFASQFLESGLCAETERTLLTPLDDLKAWLRQSKGGEELQKQVHEALLGQEDKDRAKAIAAGKKFDLVDYELEMMSGDESYEQFNPGWVRSILALVIEEADALQAFAKAEIKSDFSIAASFILPDPRKNPLLSPADIEASLRKFGADDKLIARCFKAQGKRPEYSGAILLELGPRGVAPALPQAKDTGFVRVGLVDARAGDECDAALRLAYPLELEGYFLLSFDAARSRLTLKDEP